jgi:hypothetical protein
MKRIGRYLITALGMMTLGGAPSLFARDFDRVEFRREDRREIRREYRRFDRDDFYRRDCRRWR